MKSIVNFGSRKIQIIHGSAFINLPRAWIKTNHLQKGDSVNIALEENGTLTIICQKATREGDGNDGL
jgi:antitoxin component of MazEF toxin-antitoxin module